jgi:hypothetical protein
MADSNRVLELAEALMRGLSPEEARMAWRARRRRWRAFLRRVRRAAMAMLAIAFGTALFGFFVAPIGIEGLMLAFIAMVVVAAVILGWPGGRAPTPQALASTDLALLPQRIEEWLEQQRPLLPPPAARLVDGIGLRLEAITPQLQTLDPREPAAAEVRKLICDELPELVRGYQRVPAALRTNSRNGTSPDRQLVDGLTLVESELARMTEQLATGDLHRLATQGRYLELKYKSGEGP